MTPTPRRIQRKRTKGARFPAGAIYVGRPSRWGNPWQLGSAAIGRQPNGEPWTIDDILRWYELWVRERPDVAGFLAPLRGRDLACFCDLSDRCHADVLLELANR